MLIKSKLTISSYHVQKDDISRNIIFLNELDNVSLDFFIWNLFRIDIIKLELSFILRHCILK